MNDVPAKYNGKNNKRMGKSILSIPHTTPCHVLLVWWMWWGMGGQGIVQNNVCVKESGLCIDRN